VTRDEVIDLLTVMTAFDRRTGGPSDVDAWQAAVGDLDFEDARDAAVGHYRDTDAWLMPAHIRRRVKAIRAARLERAPVSGPPEELADNPAAYIQALRDQASADASGRRGPHAIGGAA
jgi:hypothetical protein